MISNLVILSIDSVCTTSSGKGFTVVIINHCFFFPIGRWCDVFSPEQLSVLQFNADLKAYWLKGKHQIFVICGSMM